MCKACDAIAESAPCAICISTTADDKLNIYSFCDFHFGAVVGASIGILQNAGIFEPDDAVKALCAVMEHQLRVGVMRRAAQQGGGNGTT